MEDMTYALSGEEAAWLDAIARKRGMYWRARGLSDPRVDRKRSSFEIDRTGAYGEYAASQLLGGDFNEGWDRQDDGHDLVIDGVTVQVKTSGKRYPGRQYLMFAKQDSFISDVALLVAAPSRTVMLIGWCTREEFARHAEIKDFGAGWGPQLALRESRLHPVQDFGQAKALRRPPEPVAKAPASPRPAPMTDEDVYRQVQGAWVRKDVGMGCRGCNQVDPDPNATLLDFSASMHYGDCSIFKFGTDEIRARTESVSKVVAKGVDTQV